MTLATTSWVLLTSTTTAEMTVLDEPQTRIYMSNQMEIRLSYWLTTTTCVWCIHIYSRDERERAGVKPIGILLSHSADTRHDPLKNPSHDVATLFPKQPSDISFYPFLTSRCLLRRVRVSFFSLTFLFFFKFFIFLKKEKRKDDGRIP